MFKVTNQQFDKFTFDAEEKFITECVKYFTDEIEADWLKEKTPDLRSYLRLLFNETKQFKIEEKEYIFKYMLASIMTDENEKDEKANLDELKKDLKSNQYDTEDLLHTYLEYYT